MSKFYRDSLNRTKLEEDNVLTPIKAVIKLIENSEFYNELILLFKIDIGEKVHIEIPGLSILIREIISKDAKYEKFDVNVNLSDVTLFKFSDDGAAILKITSENNKEIFGTETIYAETAYNAKSDYFESVYRLDTFAKFCFKEGHIKLLKDNIAHLNEYYQASNNFDRSLRLLKDIDKTYYIRAITSTTHYNKYDNRFSLFVAVMALHNLSMSTNKKFRVASAEFDESHIKVFFEKDGSRNIKGVGLVRFMVEVSNDEIKREAMKFSAAFSIVSDEFELFFKPEKLKTELISIQHNFNPSTVFNYLSELNDFIDDAESEIINDVKGLADTKNPDELRHLLYRKVEATKNDVIKQNRFKLKTLLLNKISTLSELLRVMNKVELIVSDLETNEYLRYIFYDILIKKNS